MTLQLQSRRVFRPAAFNQSSVSWHSFLVPCFQRRTLFWQKNNSYADKPPIENPLTKDYLEQKPKKDAHLRGDLAPSSIFEDENIAGPKPLLVHSEKQRKAASLRNPTSMAAALDPDPGSRVRWERKMVIREIHKRGRLSRTQLLKRQERESLSKSHNIKTSVKKLGPLARQIAGKSVEEAIVQMRFSKKKAAIEVRKHLEHARNEAIVRRGMGLGELDAQKSIPTIIKTKDGKRVRVTDSTALYVDQAWVGKGDFTTKPDFRARGQINIMHRPTTHIAVLLKEEATRLRQHEEREEKTRNRKVWVQLPNRPITSQRPYYSW